MKPLDEAQRRRLRQAQALATNQRNVNGRLKKGAARPAKIRLGFLERDVAARPAKTEDRRG